MARSEVLDRLNALLDADSDSSIDTSITLPAALLEAASLAVEELGVSSSTTALTARALRSTLESEFVAAALEAHYEQHPATRPRWSEVAMALAEQDGSPLADRT